MAPRYFYDVPVYRIAEERYYQERDHYIDKVMNQDELRIAAYKRDTRLADVTRERLIRSFGGCWQFNEIVGYIKLHFLGSQIRGEYYGQVARRLLRSRRKYFEWKTWKIASEIDIPDESNSKEIFNLILQYLKDCKIELPRRYIDAEYLEVIGPHVDWQSLYSGKR